MKPRESQNRMTVEALLKKQRADARKRLDKLQLSLKARSMSKHRHSMVRLSANQGGGADMEPDENGAWVPNWYASELEAELVALWHFATCPYDHCQRCCDEESIIMSIRDRIDP